MEQKLTLLQQRVLAVYVRLVPKDVAPLSDCSCRGMLVDRQRARIAKKLGRPIRPYEWMHEEWFLGQKEI